MRLNAIFLVAVFALTAAAQDKPNFSGKWVLDPQHSDFGDFPATQSQVNVIDHKEPKIKLTQTIKGDAIPGGEATNEREFTTDGKESTNKSGDRELKSVTKWDNDKLVTTVRLDTPDGAIEINDSWIVADAGKHMVVTGHFTGRTLLLARQGSPSRPSSAPLFSIHLGLALLGNS